MLPFEPRSPDSEFEVLHTISHKKYKKYKKSCWNLNPGMFTQLFEMVFLIFKRVCNFLKINSSDPESEVLTTTPHNRKKIMFTQLFEMVFSNFKKGL